jgi:hypothetical protein
MSDFVFGPQLMIEPGSVQAGRWYLTRNGNMARIERRTRRAVREAARSRYDWLVCLPPSASLMRYDADGVPDKVECFGISPVDYSLAFLVQENAEYEPTGEYRRPRSGDEAWFRVTGSSPANDKVVLWAEYESWAAKNGINGEELDLRQRRRSWAGRRVILRKKASAAKEELHEEVSTPAPGSGIRGIKLSRVKYADLERSGLVPKAVLEYVRARQFDRASGHAVPATMIDDVDAGFVFLARLPNGMFCIEIGFVPRMPDEDFEKVKAALAAERDKDAAR